MHTLTLVIAGIVAWALLSVPLGIVVGRTITHGERR
ncbi:ABC-type proline/glycine betaine transport system permease subunit [Microbacterium sp. SORGH_AS 888]|nr:ABC-type proline/glycine betaine transport system permease subunit [Microbacterium sp. SORGH_AS_0888]